jgi:hypothetical protein
MIAIEFILTHSRSLWVIKIASWWHRYRLRLQNIHSCTTIIIYSFWRLTEAWNHAYSRRSRLLARWPELWRPLLQSIRITAHLILILILLLCHWNRVISKSGLKRLKLLFSNEIALIKCAAMRLFKCRLITLMIHLSPFHFRPNRFKSWGFVWFHVIWRKWWCQLRMVLISSLKWLSIYVD